MHRSLLLIAAVGLVTGLLSCAKEEADDPDYRPASITFRSDTGYTSISDTFDLGDTIRVGVIVQEGTVTLQRFLVQRALDGGPAEGVDTLPISGGYFTFDTTLFLRNVAGTEKWTFIAEERGGDRSQRSLTFITP